MHACPSLPWHLELLQKELRETRTAAVSTMQKWGLDTTGLDLSNVSLLLEQLLASLQASPEFAELQAGARIACYLFFFEELRCVSTPLLLRPHCTPCNRCGNRCVDAAAPASAGAVGRRLPGCLPLLRHTAGFAGWRAG